MLLSAISKDGNNQMFSICWAVVEGENRSSCGWFIELLKEQLGLDDGTGWSVIFDQQKVRTHFRHITFNIYVCELIFGHFCCLYALLLVGTCRSFTT
ncbi:hypothetical protein LINPERHAP2_LOCUS36252 [Linum perenne]